MSMVPSVGFAGFASWLCAGLAWASADPEAGKAFAGSVCGECHATVAGAASPLAEAPPFTAIVARWPPQDLAEALAEGIVVGHSESRMPEFQLPPERIDDLIGYMETLR